MLYRLILLIYFAISRPHPSFFYVELVCNMWFSGEFLLRMLFCPKVGPFLKTPVNIIDFIATISFYIDWGLDSALSGANRWVQNRLQNGINAEESTEREPSWGRGLAAAAQ